MNDAQLYGFFAIEYEEDGVTPKFANPFDAGMAGLTPESVYKAYLWKIGIVDKAQQAELWKAEKVRRAGRGKSTDRASEQAAGSGVRSAPPDLD